MAVKNLDTRLVLKHDTTAHWDVSESFVPMDGEIIIYNDGETLSDGSKIPRFKVGDGENAVINLKFSDTSIKNTIGDTVLSTTAKTLTAAINELVSNKQERLIAGTNIIIANDGKTISVPGGGSGGSYITLSLGTRYANKVVTMTLDGSTYSTTLSATGSGEFNSVLNIGLARFTCEEEVTVLEIPTFSKYTLINFIPDGDIITPVGSVRTWISCAGITGKSYTTIAEVLEDNATLLALINNENARKYMVRSTSFSSGICANSTAMTYIGASNACTELLLSDQTWFNSLCRSEYFESVLTQKVPTMTSDTAPSGTAFKNNAYSGSAYVVFNGVTDMASKRSYLSLNTASTNLGYVGYDFVNPVSIKRIDIVNVCDADTTRYFINSAEIIASENKTEWNIISEFTPDLKGPNAKNTCIFLNDNKYRYWAIRPTSTTPTARSYFSNVQFYGR